MSGASSDARQHVRAERGIDVVATVLLALATLATAWAGYQSSRWHSEAGQGAGESDGEPY